MCAYTTGVDSFTVLAWNPAGQNSSSWLRLPVTGGVGWSVTDVATKVALPSQTSAIDARTHQLPLLYLNKYKMNNATVERELGRLANQATHVLTFNAPLPPVGYATFNCKKEGGVGVGSSALRASTAKVVTNGVYSVSVDPAAGMVTSIKNLKSGVETSFNLSWGYYASSEGGCTKLPNSTESCNSQASGAYLFRPAIQHTFRTATTQPTLTVEEGPLVSEIKQTFSGYASHVIRLTKGSPFVEVEWTAGPIPVNGGPDVPPVDPESGKPDPEAHGQLKGKELVLKFSSGLESKKTFYADS
jgi:alpha-mannosidase